MKRMTRRSFLTTTTTAAAAGAMAVSTAGVADGTPGSDVDADGAASKRSGTQPNAAREAVGDGHRGSAVISSANGSAAVALAMKLMVDEGVDPAEAVVRGVNLVEDDPNDMSVGLGGLPNERGVVELDSSVMHGPTHKAGAVAALQNIRNPSRVALEVLRRTDHVLLVGQGALDFAKALGFKEENLLTDRARRAWLRWKENLNPKDDWLDADQRDLPVDGQADAGGIPHTWGTIHCSAVNGSGDLGAVTTTSGLSYKIPGRVGDSPIIGAGMYVDNEIGSAGATGRGEAVIQNCGAYAVVREMEAGATPTEACVAALQRIADRTRQKRLLDDQGRPNFNVVFYAVRKDGAYGGASMWSGGRFAINDGKTNSIQDAAFLFRRGR